MTIKSYLVLFFMMSVSSYSQTSSKELAKTILDNKEFQDVKIMATEIVKTGFNAGDGYEEVWIRDYNTFIELSSKVFEADKIKENLLVFLRLQGDDGNIVDGFIPKSKVVQTEGGYKYIYTDLEPNYCGHKNTVETDHESSLVQAVYKYIKMSQDIDFLNRKVGKLTVADRLDKAMQFLVEKRWSDKYGLIYGATTADWGDVQHSHPWGVYITDDTHYAVDIYDNAMMLIALQNLMELVPDMKLKWSKVYREMKSNVMDVLWDKTNQKFIPHVYLDKSPYPDDFDENQIYYHGGTAIAIEAGLLSKKQIDISLQKMIENVKQSGAASIGLTLYPPYPDWAFKNKGMYPYGYQNGGDWTWFGARMIQQLVHNSFVQEAYEQLLPMTNRVVKNDGFYEWYTRENRPEGSGTFRGSAGVLYKAISLLEEWAKVNEK